jgi:hypothetical protein
MVVRASKRHGFSEQQAARHPEVNQQQPAFAQVQKKIFPPSAHSDNAHSWQSASASAEWPTQWFSSMYTQNACARDAVREAQTGHFNFGQFWHRR